MKHALFKQCSMKRGNVTRVEWIPTEYAKVGKVLRLRDDGVWVDGWVVETANGEAQEPPNRVVFGSLDIDSMTEWW
jgi:hypothetical protein